MGNQQYRRAVVARLLAQLRKHPCAILRIQIPGRLVGQHELRAMDQRSRQRHALLLTPGQLGGQTRFTSTKPQRLEQCARPIRRVAIAQPQELERERRVLEDREIRKKMKRLKYESHGATAKHGTAIIVQIGNDDAIEDHRSAIGPIEARDNVQESRFADPGFAGDGDAFPGDNVQIHAGEKDTLCGGAIGLPEVSNGQHRRTIPGFPPGRKMRRFVN